MSDREPARLQTDIEAGSSRAAAQERPGRRLICLLAFSCLVVGAHAQNASPTPHQPETMRVDGIHYGLAHLDHFDGEFLTVVHQYGRAVVRWDDLDPAIQKEYAVEHRAAVAAAKPAAPVPKLPPPVLKPARNQPPPGQELKLSDGTVFHDAVILSSDPSSITIRHRTGVTRVDLATVPDDDRAKLAPSYDPRAAAEYKAAETRAEEEATRAHDYQANLAQFDASSLNFRGKIKQIADDGALMEGGGHADDQTKEVVMNGTPMKVATVHGESEYFETVFVAGVGDENVDGDSWSGRVWPAGRYQYTTVMGAKRTIQRYAASRELALRLMTSDRAAAH